MTLTTIKSVRVKSHNINVLETEVSLTEVANFCWVTYFLSYIQSQIESRLTFECEWKTTIRRKTGLSNFLIYLSEISQNTYKVHLFILSTESEITWDNFSKI